MIILQNAMKEGKRNIKQLKKVRKFFLRQTLKSFEETENPKTCHQLKAISLLKFTEWDHNKLFILITRCLFFSKVRVAGVAK